MLFFVLFLVMRHIKSSVTVCRRKKKIVQSHIWKYTDFLKLLTVLISPDLIRHQRHQNRPKFTFAILDQQEVVHIEIPSSNATKHWREKKIVTLPPIEKFWLYAAFLTYPNPPLLFRLSEHKTPNTTH